MSHTQCPQCTESEFRSIPVLNDHFICVVEPHQASAKPHLPAELPRTLKVHFPSTTLCFTVCPATKTANSKAHKHTHILTTAAPNIWCWWAGLFAKGGSCGAQRFHACCWIITATQIHLYCHRFYTNMECRQDSNCITGREQGTIELLHQW